MALKHKHLKLERSAEVLPTNEEALAWIVSVMEASGFKSAGSDGAPHGPDWVVWTEWFEPIIEEVNHPMEGEGARVDVFYRDYFGDEDDKEGRPEARACPYLLLTVPAHQYESQAEPTHPYHDPPSGKMPTGKARKVRPNWKPKGSSRLVDAAIEGAYLPLDDMMAWIWDALKMTGYHPFRYDHDAEYGGWVNWRAWFTDREQTIRIDLFGDFDREAHQRKGEAPCPFVAVSFYDYLGPPRVVPTF